MKKHIPLDDLVVEIKRRIKEIEEIGTYLSPKGTLTNLLCYIKSLEVKELPIWEKVSPDTGQTTLYKDGDKSYLERFGYRIDLKDLDKLPKKNLKAQKGEGI